MAEINKVDASNNGLLMRNLFGAWPKEHLAQIYSSGNNGDDGFFGTGLGVLYLSALFILTLYYERAQNKRTALVFKIAIISFMFIPLSLPIQLIGRVGMYFAPATIVVYPIILMDLKNPIYKIIFLSLLIFMTIFGFFQFFSSEVWRDAFETYQTIFSAPQIY